MVVADAWEVEAAVTVTRVAVLLVGDEDMVMPEVQEVVEVMAEAVTARHRAPQLVQCSRHSQS